MILPTNGGSSEPPKAPSGHHCVSVSLPEASTGGTSTSGASTGGESLFSSMNCDIGFGFATGIPSASTVAGPLTYAPYAGESGCALCWVAVAPIPASLSCARTAVAASDPAATIVPTIIHLIGFPLSVFRATCPGGFTVGSVGAGTPRGASDPTGDRPVSTSGA